MPTFAHDGLRFHYLDRGAGLPFIFQHGLGADVGQPAELCPPQPGVRLVSMDCRGHGETRPVGDPARLSFAGFADDLLALADHLGLARFVLGGISMGAGLALTVVVRRPERVCGLVLSRPAWLDAPMPPNLRMLAHVGELIRDHGPAQGKALFLATPEYAAVAAEAPEVARSLLGQFDHPRAAEAVDRLIALPHDAPTGRPADWAAIAVPTLVLVTSQDPMHPRVYGETLVRAIPGAQLKEVTAKSVNRARHAVECRAAIGAFLAQIEGKDYDAR